MIKNSCDGCCAGMRVVDGLHYSESPFPHMSCQKKDYDRVNIIEKLKSATCPECGDGVIVPAHGNEGGINGDNPIVYCKEMGHWAGMLDECK